MPISVDWPADGKLQVPALGKTVSSAYLLASPKSALKFGEDNTGITIQLPGKSLDPIATVIVLESK
jgi:alpha-L-fucosidase